MPPPDTRERQRRVRSAPVNTRSFRGRPDPASPLPPFSELPPSEFSSPKPVDLSSPHFSSQEFSSPKRTDARTPPSHGSLRTSDMDRSPSPSSLRTRVRFCEMGPISDFRFSFFDWYGWSRLGAPAAAAAPEAGVEAPDGGASLRLQTLILLDNSAFSRSYPQSNPRFGSASANSRPARSSSPNRVASSVVCDAASTFRVRARRPPGAWQSGQLCPLPSLVGPGG